jgi:DME family drug/metabolite transporter
LLNNLADSGSGGGSRGGGRGDGGRSAGRGDDARGGRSAGRGEAAGRGTGLGEGGVHGRDPRHSTAPRALVLASAVLFGTTGTAQALGPDGLSPLGVGAARIVVGALLLVVAARVLAPKPAAGATAAAATTAAGRPWSRAAVALGGAGVAGYQLSFFAAVHDTGVALGTVVALGSAPVFAGLLARVTSHARLDARWAICTALATAGVAVLVASGRAAHVSVPGVALALGAGGSYAVYTVSAKRLLDDSRPPEAVMARLFGVGALLLLPVLPAVGLHEIASGDALLLALYLGAVPTALAYVLFARGLRSLPAADVATLTLAEPLTAAALGTIVLGERLAAGAAVGAALVLAGLGALAMRPAKRSAPSLPAAREPPL